MCTLNKLITLYCIININSFLVYSINIQKSRITKNYKYFGILSYAHHKTGEVPSLDHLEKVLNYYIIYFFKNICFYLISLEGLFCKGILIHHSAESQRV